MKAGLDQLLIKTLENMASAKFYILVSATVFFAVGKLDQSTWQSTVLTIAGLKAVIDAAGHFSGKTPAKPAAKDEDDK